MKMFTVNMIMMIVIAMSKAKTKTTEMGMKYLG